MKTHNSVFLLPIIGIILMFLENKTPVLYYISDFCFIAFVVCLFVFMIKAVKQWAN